jgi:hypothetical protein
VFTLLIGQAVFVDWDIQHGLMTVHQWSARSGLRPVNRADRERIDGSGQVEIIRPSW